MSRTAYVAITLVVFAVLMLGGTMLVKWAAPQAVDWLIARVGSYGAAAVVWGIITAAGVYAYWGNRRRPRSP